LNSNGKKDKEYSIKEMKKCCVINCRKKITHGKGVEIGEKVYCSMCGTIILKDLLGLG
jgi:hypothetical protein